jgi:hypothetical protein
MQITCGFCDYLEENDLPTENDSITYRSTDEIIHMCEDKAYYLEHTDMPFVTGFGYSAATLIEADQWIKTHADTIKIDFETDVYISSTNSMPYEDYETLTGFPLDDFISPTATEITRDDEWSGIYDNRDNYQAVRHFTYKDTEPTRCTSSGNTWWTRTACGVLPEGFMPQGFTTESSHNAFREILDHNNPELTRLEFNTLQGMITETLIDLAVTTLGYSPSLLVLMVSLWLPARLTAVTTSHTRMSTQVTIPAIQWNSSLLLASVTVIITVRHG